MVLTGEGENRMVHINGDPIRDVSGEDRIDIAILPAAMGPGQDDLEVVDLTMLDGMVLAKITAATQATSTRRTPKPSSAYLELR